MYIVQELSARIEKYRATNKRPCASYATAQAVEWLRVSVSLPQLAYTVNGCAQSNAYDPDTFIEE